MKTIKATDKQTNQKITVQIEDNCTIEIQGKKFTSGGAFISDKFITAYLHEDKQTEKLTIQTWHGEIVSDKVIIINRQKICSYLSSERLYLRFEYNGKIYSGSCLGAGMVLNARLTKLKKLSE